MTINSIAGATSLLISAVKPATPAPTVAPLPGQQAAQPVKLEGQLNTFALSVLANVLESEQSLLDGKDHSKDSQTVTDAAQSLASSQQAASAYAIAQTIMETKPTPSQTVIV